GAGGADGRDASRSEQQIRGDIAEARANAADKIVVHKPPRAPVALQVGAKHPQRKHVEQNMPEPPGVVQEHVCDGLPDVAVQKLLGAKTKDLQNVAGNIPVHYGQQEEDDEEGTIDDQQPLDAAREVFANAETGAWIPAMRPHTCALYKDTKVERRV